MDHIIRYYEEKNAILSTIHGRMQGIIDRLDRFGWIVGSLDHDLLRLELQILGEVLAAGISENQMSNISPAQILMTKP